MQQYSPFSQPCGKMLDLNDLRIFAYVATLDSLSTAAKALSIHKSSVSRSIVRLEVALNATLLDRTTRKVQLTGRGIALKGHCIDILARVDETIAHVAPLATEMPSRSRIRVDQSAISTHRIQ
ncbi:LysR family transcriptional regulator [Variovorax sp. Sphag1AA]|uniref:LysR family transcriptional regulator n=1 Tax=Variovorax sp. Sphag1AA TaxID=2587027 RepID=UPI001609F3FA|nr:LysR family transcriptional regulator [Variovorax sp. Sphag1AA]MBB3181076.1 DNA-binding transcriptional LysR family regulator [Variovorax sp. Sphag1AA]